MIETHDGSMRLEFGGEEHLFRITVPVLAKIEEDCNAGPGVIAQGLARALLVLEHAGAAKSRMVEIFAAGLGDWRIAHVRAVIFHGLIGGGMETPAATRLVRRWIDDRGLMGLVENVGVAFSAITASGPKDDPVGESAAAAGDSRKATRSRRSRTAARASA